MHQVGNGFVVAAHFHVEDFREGGLELLAQAFQQGEVVAFRINF